MGLFHGIETPSLHEASICHIKDKDVAHRLSELNFE